ncbi:MAG: hypothetical protein DCF22_24310 [Leptolyngbya sp.]|nr:MAG: hypothetical protein DCF22_24310 [Leptolyngbya sp.]
MTAASDIRQRARELVEQLPGNSLSQAVAFMETLHPNRGAALEQPLLDQIQQTRSPEDQARLAYLRQQKEAETISDTEYEELLAFVERVEQQDAERAEALIQLVELRNVI